MKRIYFFFRGILSRIGRWKRKHFGGPMKTIQVRDSELALINSLARKHGLQPLKPVRTCYICGRPHTQVDKFCSNECRQIYFKGGHKHLAKLQKLQPKKEAI